MGQMIHAQTLRALREAKGWDRRTLAQHANVSPSVVSRLERGIQADLRVSVLVALATALAVTPDDLLAIPPQQTGSALVTELSAVVNELASLSPAHQRQVAALLRGYVSAQPA
jgi:transcriptional regulator with XRE-family HTH domain